MAHGLLRRILYDLFEWEADVLARPGSDKEHTIRREIRLDLEGGPPLYISWSSDPVQYCIGVGSKSFFDPGNDVLVDASDHPIWRRIMGGPVELRPLDTEHQILELRGPDASVHLSSREENHWTADVVTVSARRPHLGA